MVTLEELNVLRQKNDWDALAQQARLQLQTQPNTDYALRALVQALEKTNQKTAEYEDALIRLLHVKDRLLETARKLAAYYQETNQSHEAIRNYQTALTLAVDERQYKVVDDLWMELIDLSPETLPFYLQIADKLHDQKQSQKSVTLLNTLLPILEEKGDHKNRLVIYKHLMKYTPEDESLRQAIATVCKDYFGDSPDLERVLEHTGILQTRPIQEAFADLETLVLFLPDRFVQHPDWGIGRVKDLDMLMGRVKINFQRKRNHTMGLELARKALGQLDPEDFRVLSVIDKPRLETMKNENPVELIKIVLNSLNRTMTSKQLKEALAPAVMADRHWSNWWSNTSSLLRKDPYISITGGSLKTVVLRDEPASEEDDLLTRFDETKSAAIKVEQIYEYLRTTRKSDLNRTIISHFSEHLGLIVNRRRNPVERIEIWYVNEELKGYLESVQSLPEDILDRTFEDIEKSIQYLQRLRYKTHQQRYAIHMREKKPEQWVDAFRTLLTEPNVNIRNEIADALRQEDHEAVLMEVVDSSLNTYREVPHTFIWLADKSLSGTETWFDGKISKPVLIDRLLLLIDFLTSQAKRRDRDESVWLRKVASDAREIIRRDNYKIFKQSLEESDESIAESIYRRAQANEGIDGRASMDLTTIVRARHPNIFQVATEEESLVPEGVLCLPVTLSVKKALLKRLIEIDLPAVVEEIDVARQHGDLRENAEYHAAKDKQRLLASQTGELQEQLQTAQAIELSSVDTSHIGFGVRFTLKSVGADDQESYIMLGPWESDPDNNILSYQAPFARMFMGQQAGEEVEVEMPTHTGRYIVVSIDPIPQEIIATITSRIAPESDYTPNLDTESDDEPDSQTVGASESERSSSEEEHAS